MTPGAIKPPPVSSEWDLVVGLPEGDAEMPDMVTAEQQLMRDLRDSIASLQMEQESLVQRFTERLRQQSGGIESQVRSSGTVAEPGQELESCQCLTKPSSSSERVSELNNKFTFKYRSDKMGEGMKATESKCSGTPDSKLDRLNTKTLARRFIWRLYYCFSELREPVPTGRIAKLVRSSSFELLTLVMVMINGVLVIYQADRNARLALEDTFQVQGIANWGQWDYVLETLFSVYFTIEVALRLSVHRHHFFCNRDWCWNTFDFLAIVVTIPEILMAFFSGGSERMDVNFLRVLRVFRMTRSFRILRALHFVQNLRRLMECIAASIAEVFWCFVLIVFVTGIFGTFLCQVVTAFLLDRDPQQDLSEEMVILIADFGSVPASTFTLFKATSGGNDWGEYFDSLAHAGVTAPFIFVIYILFFLIAAWNIVTSLFIEKALDLAQPDVEKQLLSKRRQDMQDSRDLLRLMTTVDEDASGTISLEEFKDIMIKPQIQSFFELRSIDIKDAEVVFHMLEAATGTKEIEVQTVVNGLMHLRGLAMNIDLQSLQFQIQVQKDAFERRFADIIDSLGVLLHISKGNAARMNAMDSSLDH